MDQKIITSEFLINIGFNKDNIKITNSYSLELKNITLEGESTFDSNPMYIYKALSISECNNKGKGEFYLFLRDGSTDKRYNDTIYTLTDNLLYQQDLIDFIRLLTL